MANIAGGRRDRTITRRRFRRRIMSRPAGEPPGHRGLIRHLLSVRRRDQRNPHALVGIAFIGTAKGA